MENKKLTEEEIEHRKFGAVAAIISLAQLMIERDMEVFTREHVMAWLLATGEDFGFEFELGNGASKISRDNLLSELISEILEEYE